MNIRELTNLLKLYQELNPRHAPNFENHEVILFWYQQLQSHSLADIKRCMDMLMIKSHTFPSLRNVF